MRQDLSRGLLSNLKKKLPETVHFSAKLSSTKSDIHLDYTEP